MRTSNIILLSMLLLICVSILTVTLILRYKADHGLYVKTVPDDQGFAGLASFSEVDIAAHSEIIIQKGGANSISWSGRKGDSTGIYTVNGNVLTLHGTTGGYDERLTVTTTRLDKVRFSGGEACTIKGFNQDSLSILDEGLDTSIHNWALRDLEIDSSDIQRLRLEANSIGTIRLSNTQIAGLWFYLVNDATLNLDHCNVGWIKGHWDGLTLAMDAPSAKNGIQKIESLK